jgi:hypothetical protein
MFTIWFLLTNPESAMDFSCIKENFQWSENLCLAQRVGPPQILVGLVREAVAAEFAYLFFPERPHVCCYLHAAFVKHRIQKHRHPMS